MDELPLPGGCVDRRGSPVEHGDRYTPEGKDPCEQCTCQRGRPDSCSITSCYPPAHCHQPYLRGSGECCDYACNGTTLGSPDGADVQSATTLGLRMVASTVASFLIVALLLFMIHRLRKRRLLVMIRRLNGCRAAASLEEACLARQLALEEQGVGFLGAFCPDPPPPYTFWKPPEAYVPPGEAPPPYDAPPVLLDRHQQEIVPTPVEPVPRVASVTPPLLCGGSSTSSEVGEPPQQQQRAIRSDAYYEDGLRHVTVVLVGDQAARRRLSHCEPSARRLVQDGDKRLSLQAPPPNQNNNVYPDPTSWAGEEEEGGSETTSSCTASVDDRQGAFSPTSSESSASADVPEARQASQPAAVADPPKARRSLDRTLQRLKRFSMPKRKTSKKAATAGASSSAEGIATSCCLGHSSGMESDNSRTRGTKASDVCPQAVQQLPADGGACERLSAPTETQHSSSSHQDVGAVAMAGKPARKKAGKRKLFSLPSWDGSVLRRAPEGCGEACDPPCAQVVLESVVPAAEKVKDGTRPCSLDLPPASSTPKNHSSACPVVITVKCRPVRTEPPSAVSDQQTESPCSSSSASSKTDRQRTTEFAGVDPKPNGAVTVQPYAEAVHTIPRQSVARQVARLEAQGFRPPDASCATHMHSRSASHDNRCQERVHCKPREGQSFPQPGPF